MPSAINRRASAAFRRASSRPTSGYRPKPAVLSPAAEGVSQQPVFGAVGSDLQAQAVAVGPVVDALMRPRSSALAYIPHMSGAVSREFPELFFGEVAL
jgi:hypothetical protein